MPSARPRRPFVAAAVSRLLPAVAAALLAPLACAQKPLYRFHGDQAGDGLGHSVGEAGDVNGDGLSDLVVSAPFHVAGGFTRVFSAKDGRVLHTFRGYGSTVNGAGDVNADGHADIIAGNFARRGTARVWSGKDGKILYTFPGQPGDEFGRSAAGVGDVNEDGHDDVIVGGAQEGKAHGYAKVFSGKDGSVLFHFKGNIREAEMGSAVAVAGDVNRDGFPDFIVSAPKNFGAKKHDGTVFVYSGKDGTVLYKQRGDRRGDYFGIDVAGLADVDGDGTDDFGAVAHQAKPYSGRGYARIFSGKSGKALYTIRADKDRDQLRSISGLGDLDGDGGSDFLVGVARADENGIDSGSAWIVSGKTGKVLRKLPGDRAGDLFGTDVAGVGDLTGDGLPEFLVGAPFTDPGGKKDAGSAVVLSLVGEASYELFGSGCKGSNGSVPIIANTGLPVPGTTFSLNVSKAPPVTAVALFFGVKATRIDLSRLGMPGCVAHASTDAIRPYSTNFAGTIAPAPRIAVPADNRLLGSSFFNQFAVLDRGANPLGVTVTRGGKGTVGPGN